MTGLRFGLAVALLASNASAKEIEPSSLRIPREQLHAQVTTLCLDRLSSDVATDAWPERRAWIEQYLAAELARAGFRVVPPERVASLSEAVRLESGPLFDPVTGVRDRARIDAGREAVRRSAVAELGCQALAIPSMEYGTTAFVDNRAAWDHVEHDVGKSWGLYGWVGALSLHLELVDAGGRVLFERWAGVQSLSQWRDGRFHDITRAERLANRGWNARAVVAALGELAQPVGEDLVPCLREIFSRTRAKDRPTVGSAHLKRWAVVHAKGREARGECEAAAFTFVPPPPEAEGDEGAVTPPGAEPAPDGAGMASAASADSGGTAAEASQPSATSEGP